MTTPRTTAPTKNLTTSLNHALHKLFVSKTIKSIRRRRIKGFDDIPYIDISFTDGTKITLEAVFGMYTGSSENEYPRYIKVHIK